jgi:hypothetical protein
VIAVESTAYQYSLLYWFQNTCQRLQLTGFHFVELYTGSYSKNSRIKDTLKELTAGNILLHDDVRSLVTSQISNWNPMKRDNVDGLLDLLTYLQRTVDLYGPIMATDTNLELLEAATARVQPNNTAF